MRRLFFVLILLVLGWAATQYDPARPGDHPLARMAKWMAGSGPEPRQERDEKQAWLPWSRNQARLGALESRVESLTGTPARLRTLEERLQHLEALNAALADLEKRLQQAEAGTQEKMAAVEGRRERRLAEFGGGLESLDQRVDRLEAARGPDDGFVESGLVTAKRTDNDWKLSNVFTKERRFQKEIPFARPFARPPVVMVGLTRLDLDQEKLALRIRADKVTAQGFLLIIETHSENRIDAVDVAWIALPARAEQGEKP